MTLSVSVIIGVFNGGPYLGEAIESVLAQTYRPLELLVVDDGSTDDTADVARRYGDVTYVFQPNRGNGAARNTGVSMARGETFAFLDADDRFMPEKLALQCDALERSAELEAVFGHVREFVSPELTPQQQAQVRPPAPEPMPWSAPNLMLIRRESFFRVGPFSQSLRVGVTVDWFARATEAGLRTHMLPDVVLERRLHLQNNGLREAASRSQYALVLKAALDRRRAAAAAAAAKQR